MHIGVTQAVGCEGIDIRRADRRTEAAQLRKADVVKHDEQDVWRALRGAQRLRPRRLRDLERASHDPGESGAGLIFLERHSRLLPIFLGPANVARPTIPDARKEDQSGNGLTEAPSSRISRLAPSLFLSADRCVAISLETMLSFIWYTSTN